MCKKCEGVKIFTTCSGCGFSLCESCAHLELIGSGCGCVWSVYYCITCLRDPAINPNAIFKDQEV